MIHLFVSARSIFTGEKAYFLKDPDTEYKHKFKLADALRRARELKKKNVKLLQGQFFYFTANVPLDFTLVKNVLQTNGAEVSVAFLRLSLVTNLNFSV
jgi:hypothetical protein